MKRRKMHANSGQTGCLTATTSLPIRTMELRKTRKQTIRLSETISNLSRMNLLLTMNASRLLRKTPHFVFHLPSTTFHTPWNLI